MPGYDLGKEITAGAGAEKKGKQKFAGSWL